MAACEGENCPVNGIMDSIIKISNAATITMMADGIMDDGKTDASHVYGMNVMTVMVEYFTEYPEHARWFAMEMEKHEEDEVDQCQEDHGHITLAQQIKNSVRKAIVERYPAQAVS